jgi:uncharacterized membrane protein YkoI
MVFKSNANVGLRVGGIASLLVLVCALLLPLAALQAQPGVNPSPTGNGQLPGAESPRISQRQALELVRASFPGTVISINEVQQAGVLQYRVRMDNEGNIYTVYVDAVNGAITREQ